MTSPNSDRDSWNTEANTMDDGAPNSASGSWTHPGLRIPLWAALLGATEKKVMEATNVSLRQILKTTGRSPTQAEVDAFTEMHRDDAVRKSLCLPATMVAGCYFSYKYRGQYRIPIFGSRAKNASPLVFPSEVNPWITGRSATKAWRASRLLIYSFSSYVVISSLSSVYRLSRWISTMTDDPRLKSLTQEMRQSKLNKAISSQNDSLEKHLSGLSKDKLEEMAEYARRQLVIADEEIAKLESGETKGKAMTAEQSLQVVKTARGVLQDRIRLFEDMIARREDPQYGLGRQNELEKLEGAKSEDVAAYGQYGQQYRTKPQPQSWAPKPSQHKAPAPQTWSTSSDLDDDFDASPVSPSTRSSASSESGGSAWDKIRQQVRSEGQASGAQVPRGTPASQIGGDQRSPQGYSYGPAAEDKAAAKTQGQKEFEELLEQEKQSQAENRRW